LPEPLAAARAADERGLLAVYQEGQSRIERADLQLHLAAVDFAAPDVPGLEFLFRCTSSAMVPVAFPGQLIGGVTCEEAKPGHVMLLRRGYHGLTLAWSLSGNTFLQQALNSEPFTLEAGDEIMGEITHVRPFIPR
jgi:hypothetical protein